MNEEDAEKGTQVRCAHATHLLIVYDTPLTRHSNEQGVRRLFIFVVLSCIWVDSVGKDRKLLSFENILASSEKECRFFPGKYNFELKQNKNTREGWLTTYLRYQCNVPGENTPRTSTCTDADGCFKGNKQPRNQRKTGHTISKRKEYTQIYVFISIYLMNTNAKHSQESGGMRKEEHTRQNKQNDYDDNIIITFDLGPQHNLVLEQARDRVTSC